MKVEYNSYTSVLEIILDQDVEVGWATVHRNRVQIQVPRLCSPERVADMDASDPATPLLTLPVLSAKRQMYHHLKALVRQGEEMGGYRQEGKS